jgi:DNA-binding transcriptional LysR family regulator
MLSFIHDGVSPVSGAPAIDPGIVDSKRLQMFYAAAKEGTFAAAAQMLGVSPSAVSHAIKALEEELGCPLFKRCGPQVSPTGAAIRLLPFVEDLLFRMASIKTELAAMDGRVEQLLFAVAPGVRGMLKTTVMSEFRECFPRANVEILISGGETAVAGRREIDFEIGHAQNVPADFVRRHLLDEELQVYAAPFHGLGQQARITPAELRKNSLLFPDRLAYEQVMDQVMRKSESGMRTWILPDAESVRDLAMQGQCLAILPGWMGEKHVADGSLNLLRMTGYELRRSCCAWWKPSRPLAWIAEVFLSLLAGELEARVR